MAEVSVLDVLLYDEPVGTLTRLGDDRTIFSFNQSYSEDQNRAVLSLGFKDSLGGLISEFRPVKTKLMPFFSNLLPEGPMRTYLADRAGVKANREFFLLWVLGRDLPGAVTVRPSDGEAWPEDASGTDEDEEHRRDTAMRFSLAGVQLKFSAIHGAKGGLTIPAKGVGGSWIVKLPSTQFDGVPENEYAMMSLAKRLGMDVPEVRLVDLADIGNLPEGLGRLKGQALAVKRFDRDEKGGAIHIEDFAQIFRVYPADKYDKASYRNIASVIASEGEQSDIVEFIRRLTFNTLIGNADMHLKNWSMIYPDRRRAALAPAYDFVSTIAFIPDKKASLNFSRTKRFDGYTADELAHLAAKAMLPEKLVLDTARETVARFHALWTAEKGHLSLVSRDIEAIEAHLKTLPVI